mmetsp:Transcript_6010/g.10654  ORF Transcript_6010/g.10654 Transcript_6010/m.10654 type:complete len:99 (-) Transcript_6010:1141-1437(-)
MSLSISLTHVVEYSILLMSENRSSGKEAVCKEGSQAIIVVAMGSTIVVVIGGGSERPNKAIISTQVLELLQYFLIRQSLGPVVGCITVVGLNIHFSTV